MTPDQHDELLDEFTPHEVETTREMLRCLQGPATADSFRRMLVLFLRGHYASARNYMGLDHLACYVWNPDEKQSTLVVDFTHEETDRKPDNYPGVYVGYAESTFEKVGIGNRAGNSQDMSGTYISKEAVARYEIFHVAKRATDAYDLAELTARVLLAMGHPLAFNGGATGFEVLGMRKPTEKKPAVKTHYSVAIPIEIRYTMAVTRTLESHRIRTISNIISTEQQ